MQAIQIQISVTVGLTKELHGLLSEALGRQREGAGAPGPAGEGKGAEQRTAPQTWPEEAAPATAQEPQQRPEEAVLPQPQPEAAAPVSSPGQEGQEEKEYTVVDVRAAMDRARMRIEGADYKENPGSEAYQKWHKALTGWFKSTSAVFGAEKPSLLPDSESRRKFVECCNGLRVDGGELVEDLPF